MYLLLLHILRLLIEKSPQERGRKPLLNHGLELPIVGRIEKKSPRKGTKTELSFAQMSPYVSREDPREGDETYLTWQDSGDQDSERKKDPLHGAGCLMNEEVSL